MRLIRLGTRKDLITTSFRTSPFHAVRCVLYKSPFHYRIQTEQAGLLHNSSMCKSPHRHKLYADETNGKYGLTRPTMNDGNGAVLPVHARRTPDDGHSAFSQRDASAICLLLFSTHCVCDNANLFPVSEQLFPRLQNGNPEFPVFTRNNTFTISSCTLPFYLPIKRTSIP